MRHLLALTAVVSLFGCATEEIDDGEGFEFRVDEVGHDKCTRNEFYWKNHHAYAQNPAKKIPWPIPNGERNVACGRPMLGWISMPPQGVVSVILGHQYISARLNLAAGAPVPPEVNTGLLEAVGLLSGCGIDEEDAEYALELADTLQAYNDGLLGVPACQ